MFLPATSTLRRFAYGGGGRRATSIAENGPPWVWGSINRVSRPPNCPPCARAGAQASAPLGRTSWRRLVRLGSPGVRGALGSALRTDRVGPTALSLEEPPHGGCDERPVPAARCDEGRALHWRGQRSPHWRPSGSRRPAPLPRSDRTPARRVLATCTQTHFRSPGDRYRSAAHQIAPVRAIAFLFVAFATTDEAVPIRGMCPLPRMPEIGAAQQWLPFAGLLMLAFDSHGRRASGAQERPVCALPQVGDDP